MTDLKLWFLEAAELLGYITIALLALFTLACIIVLGVWSVKSLKEKLFS